MTNNKGMMLAPFSLSEHPPTISTSMLSKNLLGEGPNKHWLASCLSLIDSHAIITHLWRELLQEKEGGFAQLRTDIDN